MARLVLGIDARPARQGAQEFDRATGRVKNSARGAAQATDRVENSFQRLRPAISAASSALTALGGALAIRQFVRYADTATQLESRLRLVTNSSEELAKAQQTIFNLAQENRSSLEATSNLYVRLNQALQGTGRSFDEVIGVTDAFTKSLRISGASTQEAAAAAQQFSQAIAGNVVRAEEFNSLIDASPRLVRALIQELEGIESQGALRQLLENGELTRERVIEALLDSLPRLNDEFSRLDRTTSDAFTQLNNALLKSIGIIDDGSGATDDLVKAIDGIREVVASEGFQSGISSFTQLLSSIVQTGGQAVGILGAIADEFGNIQDAIAGSNRPGGGLDDPFTDLQQFFDAVGRLGAAAQGGTQAGRISETLSAIDDVRGELRELREIQDPSQAQEFRIDQLENRLVGLRETYKRLTGQVLEFQNAQQSAVSAIRDPRAVLDRAIQPSGPAPLPSPDAGSPIGDSGPNVPTPGTRPDGGQDILREQREAQRAFAREQIQRVNRTSDLIADQREELKSLGDSIRQDVITPVEEYRNRLENLNLALEANVINQDTYNRALDQAKEKLEEATGLTARYKTEIEFLENVGERAFERIGRTITEEITKGTFAFEDLKNIGLSVVSELSQAFLRLALINPLKNAIFGGNSATLNSVGGLLGELIGTGVASSGGGALASVGGVGGAVPMGSRAAGGTVSEGRPYLVGERGPEIMVPGANGAVMPNAGGGKTEVNVYSSGGEEPEIRRSRNGNGGERIDVILDRKIQEAAASGKLDKPMRARYGINPSTGTR